MPTKFDTVKFLEDSAPFSDVTINEYQEKNASFIAYYGTKAVEWDRVVNDLKLDLKVKKAELGVEIKKSGEKTTEATVANMVQADPETVLIERKLNIAIEQEASYSIAVDTFRNLGHMLVARGNALRTELGNSGNAGTAASISKDEGRAVMERIASKT